MNMRILFCCEFYFPSVGGVQEVMRQLAERMVQRGHHVTVATTRLAERNFTEHNGVQIVEFGITGNSVRGMHGEVDRYREYVKAFDGDAIMIKAAQQWTFDALWPVLDSIRTRKVFIPCGFSGLYEPSYSTYFQDLPPVLGKFDHLIFYAERYRDIDFAREHHLEQRTILPNGACDIEFSVPKDPTFRRRHNIPEDSFVFLTVGSMTGVKGHKEIAEAFSRLLNGRRNVTLLLNGNPPPAPAVVVTQPAADGGKGSQAIAATGKALGFLGGRVRRVSGLAWRSFGVLRREGLAGIKGRIYSLAAIQLEAAGRIHWLPHNMRKAGDPIRYWTERANRQPHKQVLKVDLDRKELVQAYMNADLFVFASNIEYSPLVLFETAAAGTPFLSVPVGNSEEIARWTGGGVICPAPKDDRGYTRADPGQFAAEMKRLMDSPALLKELGSTARARWEEQFSWARIADRYEAILLGAEQAEPSEILAVPADR
jgi:glycosyltransferase involved in cell wall biosynthesis